MVTKLKICDQFVITGMCNLEINKIALISLFFVKFVNYILL